VRGARTRRSYAVAGPATSAPGLSSSIASQDVYQEVFMRVYTRLHCLHDEEALQPWIARS
jgi:DNA-directed RNA polymerase specialized sigma24 family protein